MTQSSGDDFLRELLSDEDETTYHNEFKARGKAVSENNDSSARHASLDNKIRRMKQRNLPYGEEVEELPYNALDDIMNGGDEEKDTPTLSNPFLGDSGEDEALLLSQRRQQSAQDSIEDSVDTEGEYTSAAFDDDTGNVYGSYETGYDTESDAEKSNDAIVDTDDDFSPEVDEELLESIDKDIAYLFDDLEDDFLPREQDEDVDDLGDDGQSVIEVDDLSDDEDESDYDDEDDFGRSIFQGFDINAVLTQAIEEKASDVRVSANKAVRFRIHGVLERKENIPYPDERTTKDVQKYMTSSQQEQEFTRTKELDASYVIKEGKYAGRRVRSSFALEDGNVFIVMRLIEDEIPDPDDLGIPPELRAWADLPSGLVLLNGPTGSGKALRLDTPIPTPTGWTTMGDLSVGDMVLDARMEPTMVTGLSDINESPMLYRIVFADGQHVFADKDHQWIVSSRESRSLSHDYLARTMDKAMHEIETMHCKDEWVTVGELVALLQDTEYAIDHYATDIAVKNTLEFMGTLKSEGTYYFPQAQYYLAQRLEQKYHYVTNSSVFTATTAELEYQLDQEIAVPLVTVDTGVDMDTAAYTWGQEIGRSDHTIPLRDEVLRAQYSERLGLFRGIVDTVSTSEPQVLDFDSGGLAYSFVRLARSLGYLCFSGNTEHGVRVIYNTRSQDNSNWNHIFDIQQVHSDSADYSAVRCITVDSYDSSYLCADYVVTHNSTTLASILRQTQLSRPVAIITIENPVEFRYPDDGLAHVTQREVGTDTKSYANAMVSALREDPDVMLIGEARNQIEMSTLLTAADSGHLALSTLHTRSAPATLNRIKSMFEGDEQANILLRVADSLQGIANQALLRNPDGTGRFAVREILPITKAVREMVARGDVEGLTAYMQEKKITLDHELAKVAWEGKATLKEARSRANEKEDFDQYLQDLVDEQGAGNILE